MIDLIIQAAKDGKIEFTIHAVQQMNGRNVVSADIQYAISNHIICIPVKNANKLNIYGPIENKSDLYLMISCTFFDGVLIITVHKMSKKRILKNVKKRS